MPQSRSAGLLAFLLALPSLALVVPPASQAAASAAQAEASGSGSITPPGVDGLSTPGAAMEARLQRLSEAIRDRAGQLDDGKGGALPGEPWVAAGAWGNGRGRGWANRGWSNRAYGNNYYGRPVWANFRPGWGNFRNSPTFLNW